MKQASLFLILTFFLLYSLAQQHLFISLNTTNQLESVLVSSLLITLLIFIFLPVLRLITAPISFLTFGFFNWLLIILVVLVWDLLLETVAITNTVWPAELTQGYSSSDIPLPYLAVVFLLGIIFRLLYVYTDWLTN